MDTETKIHRVSPLAILIGGGGVALVLFIAATGYLWSWNRELVAEKTEAALIMGSLKVTTSQLVSVAGSVITVCFEHADKKNEQLNKMLASVGVGTFNPLKEAPLPLDELVKK